MPLSEKSANDTWRIMRGKSGILLIQSAGLLIVVGVVRDTFFNIQAELKLHGYDDALLIRRLLEGHKAYRVYHAKDGWEGLAQARQKLPDLIVTDLTMPGIGGEQTLRMIRARAPPRARRPALP